MDHMGAMMGFAARNEMGHESEEEAAGHEDHPGAPDREATPKRGERDRLLEGMILSAASTGAAFSSRARASFSIT